MGQPQDIHRFRCSPCLMTQPIGCIYTQSYADRPTMAKTPHSVLPLLPPADRGVAAEGVSAAAARVGVSAMAERADAGTGLSAATRRASTMMRTRWSARL